MLRLLPSHGNRVKMVALPIRNYVAGGAQVTYLMKEVAQGQLLVQAIEHLGSAGEPWLRFKHWRGHCRSTR